MNTDFNECPKVILFWKLIVALGLLLSVSIQISLASQASEIGSSYRILNFSASNNSIDKFTIKKINSLNSLDPLDYEKVKSFTPLKNSDLFFLTAPSQRTSGYQFIAYQSQRSILVCLKKPPKHSDVLMILTNPAAVFSVENGLTVTLKNDYCAD